MLATIVTKQKLRKRLISGLRRQPQRLRLVKSRKIARKLRRLSVYRRARVLLCYAAFDGEVETRPLLAQAIADGKRVAVPVTVRGAARLRLAEIGDPKRELTRRGPFGIPEPARPARWLKAADLELVLVPGVAFSPQGRRLGRGGGYFDRFLEKLPRRIPRVGLAFKFQVVKHLPWESHDQPVDLVITD